MEKMNSKMELDKNNCGSDSNNGQLLRDIEEISRALYLQKPSSKALVTTSNVRSKSVGKTCLSESKSKQDSRNPCADVMQKDKKSSSLWNWKKPLKALTNIRRHRFDICFFFHVHSIEGLPAYLNDFSLCVHWKRKDEVLSTHAARVVGGIAEFEETLMHKCYVHGRSGPHNAAKYEVKLFLIYASIVGAPGNSIGEHWIDLTRLLPLTLEDLEGEKGSGKWTTSFKLSGKAKGATLNVSFSFLVTRDNLVESSGNMNASNFISLTETGSSAMGHGGGLHASNGNGMLHHVGTVPSTVNHRSYLSPLSVDIKFGTEVLPNLGVELSKSISFLYQKLNEGNFHSPSGLDKLSEHVEPPKPNSESTKGIYEYENIDFFVIDQGVEMCQKDPSKCEQSDIQIIDGSAIETINVDEILKDCDSDVDEEAEHVLKVHSSSSCKEVVVDDCRQEKRNIWSKPVTVQELESAFQDMLLTESSISESPSALDEFIEHEKFTEVKSNYKASKVTKKWLSLDEIADTVATDFLKMLEIEHDPFSSNSDSALESPRERLLREFENEALASGDFILDFGAGGEEAEIGSTTPGCEDIYEDFAFSPVILPSEEQKMESLSLKNRRKVNMLENLETEALMLEWGLDEKAFQSSPHVQTDGFGSPIALSPERGELPPLGDGFGHFIPTKDGGVLRSMNRSLFRNCKNVGHLVMQVSRAAVFPARLGTDIMEILQNLASLGIEDLSLQVKTIMPLEDITGKTLQQVVLGATPRAVVRERRVELQQESLCDQDSFYQRKEVEGFQCCWSYDNLSSGLVGGEMSPGCISLENLVPSAMNRIEALTIEGLKIQCGMSDEDAPSTVSPLSSSNKYFITGKDSKFGKFFSLEGAAGSQSLDFRDDVDDVNRLMGLSIALDEWLRLDAGIIGDEDQISDHTMQLLVAHKAKCIDLVSGILTKHVNLGKASCRKHGLLGNNFTLALMVLLRDPLRNYEPVGTSMMALIQVERASVPLEQGICSTESEGDQEENPEEDGEEKKEGTPFFKITEVHLAGLITEPDEQYLWGTKAQQQSGTRWLLSSGTAKSNMNTFSKSKAIVKFYPPVMRKMQARNVLWSLTSNVHEAETGWKELTDLGPHSRNPNVIFPK
ncbi:PREDICTED: protein PLASTID MOVEMENT IMPAIRED 1-RELATED 2 [Theobroma cacao]|uniref:Protein PLASTID MOVEMENT IMPAIRED 1-RELATED 2 n=1 Tax=Theobroma cacao TaxID=3641 RepID=A0AB32UPC0_THECC|nr:PREDICTED: protein PLASTID MOVEMENT IMPAIRED 1-RELATED 2 [Theobroma cacao]XP_017982631.1 PREDICTED: protein PLASTID MOVEMENT IMPAIRED 1-RELATED 2 [Theobroma cacao]